MPYDKNTFTNWIDAGESNFGKVRSIYKQAREYVENEQSPANVPNSKEYVQYNIITSAVRRAVGELVSSGMTPTLIGGGEMSDMIKLLFEDILEENFFQEEVVSSMANFFYCEGYAGIKFIDNPYRLSKYGIGKPIICWLRPDEIWLDGNSRDGFHQDDIYRIHVKRIELEEALANPNWVEHKDEIKSSTRNQEADQSNIKFVDLYEIEYKVKEWKKLEIGDGEVIKVEDDVYYITKFINKTVQVEEPKKTGYPTFRIIPLIHTPRSSATYGKYPFGMYELMKQGQDLLNITNSVILDYVKASIKQLVLSRGATPEEQVEHKRQMAKTNGYLAARSPNARIEVIRGEPISPALTQFASQMRLMVDEITARYAPDRGQVSGDMSGRAIQSLQAASSVPEQAALKHIESAFTNLAACIYHYIRVNLANKQFVLAKNMNGEEIKISFNKPVANGYMSNNPMEVVRNGRVNNLEFLPDNASIKINVEMNPMAKQDFNLNMALLMQERGSISLIDLLKTVYPNTWQDKLRNVTKENQATALVQDLANSSPEAFEMISNLWQNQIKPQMEAAQNGEVISG